MRPNSGSRPSSIALEAVAQLAADLRHGLAVRLADLDAGKFLSALRGHDEENVHALALVLTPTREAHPKFRHLREPTRHRLADQMGDGYVHAGLAAHIVDVGEQRGGVEIKVAVELRIVRRSPCRARELPPAMQSPGCPGRSAGPAGDRWLGHQRALTGSGDSRSASIGSFLES